MIMASDLWVSKWGCVYWSEESKIDKDALISFLGAVRAARNKKGQSMSWGYSKGHRSTVWVYSEMFYYTVNSDEKQCG